MKRLLWIVWHQTPYHDYLFDEIAKKFHLEVVYIRKALSTHPWKGLTVGNYKSTSWESQKDKIAVISQIMSSRHDLRIVVGWNHPLMLLALMFYSIFNRTYAIWTDTPQTNPNRSWLKKTVHRLLIKGIVLNAKVLLVTGKIGVKKMLSIYKDVRVANFPTATNLDFYRPSGYRVMPSGTTMVCSVGRLLNSHKGTDIAIEAFRLLKERNNSLKFEYRIVGDGPDRASLTDQIKKYGLENEVKLIGWLERDGLAGGVISDQSGHAGHLEVGGVHGQCVHRFAKRCTD